MAAIKILFVVNAPEYFISHRFAIAEQAKSSGCEIHVASRVDGPADVKAVSIIKSSGFLYHDLPIKRGGQNPLSEANAIFRMFCLMQKLKPDVAHLITIKSVLYGGLAARWAGVPSVLAAVAGLGTVFIAQSPIAKVRRLIVSSMLRYALQSRNLVVVFQNPDDRDTLLEMRLLNLHQSRIIRGSGVKLDEYPYTSEPSGTPVVVMAARLLKDKGVVEFIEAARILRERGIDVDMRIVGAPDFSNPTSISKAEFNRWSSENQVRMLGHRNDVANQYSAAHIVCLPSYREGLPKALVEAAACGRAVVTTDVPGCRDAITPGVTGLLVPARDAAALAGAIQELIDNPRQRQQMGLAGRELAERAFTIEKIVDQHMTIYKELLSGS
ncbi:MULTISPECIES: glycosyltransferase family 4 protein [Stutzerimonas stutzeri subgroup]|uniref:Glycosyltransferase involved in cell wall biosynthesis n=2 Tax=Stutzerimonas stutzeri subgroup TaxID=578833 RepID=A0A5S5BHD0_STUST|nr:glycosyltransferase family 4 protein [Stutzerimonas stutzeri]MCH2340093.1 glycosyltransferase family 4 protein [Pseudomonas sp.]TYP65460.1 glycosyltransferase involved in cell wall biosynthesis [Stutzerimonas stutzeri]